MMKADLHMHSRVSDGSYTIGELAELAAEKWSGCHCGD